MGKTNTDCIMMQVTKTTVLLSSLFVAYVASIPAPADTVVNELETSQGTSHGHILADTKFEDAPCPQNNNNATDCDQFNKGLQTLRTRFKALGDRVKKTNDGFDEAKTVVGQSMETSMEKLQGAKDDAVNLKNEFADLQTTIRGKKQAWETHMRNHLNELNGKKTELEQQIAEAERKRDHQNEKLSHTEEMLEKRKQKWQLRADDLETHLARFSPVDPMEPNQHTEAYEPEVPVHEETKPMPVDPTVEPVDQPNPDEENKDKNNDKNNDTPAVW